MNRSENQALHVRSDLQVEVDGINASVLADGQQLTVITDDAADLLAHARAASPPGAAMSMRLTLRQVGRLLDEAGLSTRVIAGNGTLIEAGRDCESLAGRLLLGSNTVRFGPARVVTPTLISYLRSRVAARPRARYAPAGLIIAALAIGAGVRRRRTSGRTAP